MGQQNVLNKQQQNKVIAAAKQAQAKSISAIQAEANKAGIKINVQKSLDQLINYAKPIVADAQKKGKGKAQKFQQDNAKAIANAQKMTIAQIRRKAIAESKKQIGKVQNEDLASILSQLQNLAVKQSNAFVQKHGKKKPATYGKGKFNALKKQNQKKINDAINKGSKYVKNA